jgi:hypothetical protein
LKLLKYNFDSITEDDKFFKLNYIAMNFIVQVNYLPVKEIEVWNAVLKWAKYKRDSTDGKVLRSYIFDFLKYIRFLTMDCKDFDEYVVPSGILLEEEINDICKAFVQYQVNLVALNTCVTTEAIDTMLSLFPIKLSANL